MTEIFKSSRPSNRRFIIFQLIIGILIVAAWPVYSILYLKSYVNDSYYYVIGAVFIFSLVREAIQTRVTEVEFNSETQQIIIHFEKLITRRQQKSVLFKYAKLEVDTRVGWRKETETLSIYILSDKVEVCKVDNRKDGFFNDTLISIRDSAKKLSLPVAKY